jgi:hypothetical protein
MSDIPGACIIYQDDDGLWHSLVEVENVDGSPELAKSERGHQTIDELVEAEFSELLEAGYGWYFEQLAQLGS